MDDRVRQLPGVEMFRRSSSLVANPTSQGISVRGLGSTSASRTLVTQDDVPLNDPIGGWIHWQEQPELAIHSVELVRGGASDLYGSSAIGGVLNFITARPSANLCPGPQQLRQPQHLQHRRARGNKTRPLGPARRRRSHRHRRLHPARPRSARPHRHRLQRAQPERHPHRRTRERSAPPLRARQCHERGPRQRHALPDQRHASLALCHRCRLAKPAQRQRASSASTAQPNTTARLSRASPTRLRPLIPTAPTAAAKRPRVTPTFPPMSLAPSRTGRRPLGAGFLLLAGADVHDVRIWDQEQTLQRRRCAHHPQRSPARRRPLRRSDVGSSRMDRHRLRPHGLVPKLRRQSSPVERLRVDPRCRAATSAFAESLRSAYGHLAQISCSTGPSRHRAFAPFARPRPASSIAPRKWATSSLCPTEPAERTRHRLGNRHRLPEQVGQPSAASYFLTEVNRPIVAVTTNPNSSPILLKRENLGQITARASRSIPKSRPGAGSPSTAATSTRTPPSPAAPRTTATGFPRSPAIWPPSTCALL